MRDLRSIQRTDTDTRPFELRDLEVPAIRETERSSDRVLPRNSAAASRDWQLHGPSCFEVRAALSTAALELPREVDPAGHALLLSALRGERAVPNPELYSSTEEVNGNQLVVTHSSRDRTLTQVIDSETQTVLESILASPNEQSVLVLSYQRNASGQLTGLALHWEGITLRSRPPTGERSELTPER